MWVLIFLLIYPRGPLHLSAYSFGYLQSLTKEQQKICKPKESTPILFLNFSWSKKTKYNIENCYLIALSHLP